MTQAQTDDLMIRLDAEHDDLLRRLDDLDQKISSMLEEWAPSATHETVGTAVNLKPASSRN